jgi:hypothetical protein
MLGNRGRFEQPVNYGYGPSNGHYANAYPIQKNPVSPQKPAVEDPMSPASLRSENSENSDNSNNSFKSKFE